LPEITEYRGDSELRLGGIMKGRIGVLLLSTWLILKGIIPLLDFHFRNLDVILALLALAAGVLLLLDK